MNSVYNDKIKIIVLNSRGIEDYIESGLGCSMSPRVGSVAILPYGMAKVTEVKYDRSGGKINTTVICGDGYLDQLEGVMSKEYYNVKREYVDTSTEYWNCILNNGAVLTIVRRENCDMKLISWSVEYASNVEEYISGIKSFGVSCSKMEFDTAKNAAKEWILNTLGGRDGRNS